MKIIRLLILGIIVSTNAFSFGTDGCDYLSVATTHFDGPDASTTPADLDCDGNGIKTITANDNAQLDTVGNFKESALFDGTLDYFSFADSADFNLGSGDFTLDFWVRWSVNPNATLGGLVGQAVDTNNRVLFYASNAAGLTRLGFVSLTGGVIDANYLFDISLSADTWYHIAWVRSGSTMYLFIDGVSRSLTVSTAVGTLPDLAATLDVGRSFFNAAQQYLNGRIDEFRLTKGKARWTTNFPAPSSPYCNGCEMMQVLD